jgi:mannose/fructose/N-acetylgalactosamine-specific phosphotransferase system component IID
MEWFPIVFFTFKAIVLATGMFFAIKWHYDQGKKEQDKKKQKRAVLLATGKVIAIFVVALLVLTLVTWFVLSKLSLDLGF